MTYYATEEEARAAGLKPGEEFGPGIGGVIPWRKEDLDPNDTVTFVPLPLPGTKEGDGEQFLLLTVNGLTCNLKINVANTCNRMFYDAYQDNFNQYRELEQLKRTGLPLNDYETHLMGGYGLTDIQWHFDPAPGGAWLDQHGRTVKDDKHTILTDRDIPMTPEEREEENRKQAIIERRK